MTQNVISITTSRYISKATIRQINEAVADKTIDGIFFHPDSLFKCTIDILVSEPEVICMEKIVSAPEPMPGKGNGTSRYRGVYWDKEANKWRAQISFKGKKKLKRFENELEAALQYDEWALEVRALGGKTYLNFEKVAK